VKPKARPTSAYSPEDYKKKETQRPKFDKLRVKIDSKKDEAASKFKEGQYAEAIKLYKTSAELMGDTLDQFPLFKKEIA